MRDEKIPNLRYTSFNTRPIKPQDTVKFTIAPPFDREGDYALVAHSIELLEKTRLDVVVIGVWYDTLALIDYGRSMLSLCARTYLHPARFYAHDKNRKLRVEVRNKSGETLSCSGRFWCQRVEQSERSEDLSADGGVGSKKVASDLGDFGDGQGGESEDRCYSVFSTIPIKPQETVKFTVAVPHDREGDVVVSHSIELDEASRSHFKVTGVWDGAEVLAYAINMQAPKTYLRSRKLRADDRDRKIWLEVLNTSGEARTCGGKFWCTRPEPVARNGRPLGKKIAGDYDVGVLEDDPRIIFDLRPAIAEIGGPVFLANVSIEKDFELYDVVVNGRSVYPLGRASYRDLVVGADDVLVLRARRITPRVSICTCRVSVGLAAAPAEGGGASTGDLASLVGEVGSYARDRLAGWYSRWLSRKAEGLARLLEGGEIHRAGLRGDLARGVRELGSVYASVADLLDDLRDLGGVHQVPQKTVNKGRI